MKPLLWLFDLDNTLHDASHGIFPVITANMNRFLADVLGEDGKPASSETVNAVRLAYWKRYGATLLGMMAHHQVRMEDFLHAAHQFDDLPSLVRAEQRLQHFLKPLPGRKILFTNAPGHYSRQVVRHIGLHRHFARHIAIEGMFVHGRLRPKPSKQLLRKLLAKEKVHPRRAVLIEDTLKNLKHAKAIGMRTVLVTQYLMANPLHHPQAVSFSQLQRIKRPAYVDVKVKSVKQLCKHLHRLQS